MNENVEIARFETTDLAPIERDVPLSLEQTKRHGQLVQAIAKDFMRPGVHYGLIPGCGDKPALYKSGAEVLAMVFRIAPKLEMEDLSTADVIRYRCTCIATHQGTGLILGEGIGECSSAEEKYAWRNIVSDAEWEHTLEPERRIKFVRQSKDNPNGQIRQVRMNRWNLANTVLKMAKKRALVDMALTVTAASDQFTQDIEDSEDVAAVIGSYPGAVPAAADATTGAVTEEKSQRVEASKGYPGAAVVDASIEDARLVTERLASSVQLAAIEKWDDIFKGTLLPRIEEKYKHDYGALTAAQAAEILEALDAAQKTKQQKEATSNANG